MFIYFFIINHQYQRVINGVLFSRIPCSASYWRGLVGCFAYISGMWKGVIKKPLADLSLTTGAWYSPFRLRIVDQVCPENLGTLYKDRP
jgi:hypothetical protein